MDSMEQVAPRWYQDWDRSVGEMLDFLALGQRSLEHGAVSVDIETLDRLGMFGKERGAGTVSAAAALFLATRYTSQPTQGLLASAFLRNTDSDTVAAMTGALLGALAGRDWLGDLPRGLQDGRYLEEIAGSLAGSQLPKIDSFRWEPSVRTYIYRRLDKASPGESLDLPIFGNSTITEIEDYATRSQSFIRSWLLMSEIGQSLTIKRIDKGKDGRPRWLGRYFNPNDRAASSSEVAAPPGRRRAGLVRLVSDLSVASRFYEEVVGLRRERATKSFISFGWLALEESTGQEAEQLRLPSREELEQSRQSIRVYIDEELVARRHREVAAIGLQVGAVRQESGCSGFRCADPDGYVVEFRGYMPRTSNGSLDSR
jgi:hypothetical protein